MRGAKVATLAVLAAVASAAAVLAGCTAEPSPPPTAANPVDLVRKAGAVPPPDAVLGETDVYGHRFATGTFGTDPDGANGSIIVRTYPTADELGVALATNLDAVSDDSHKIIVGDRWYAAMTGVDDLETGGTSWPELPAEVAERLGGTLR